MDRTITEDVGRGVKVGLAVFDSDGARVGDVDKTDRDHGWMLVREGELYREKLWIPYRLVKSVDEREIFVTALKGRLEHEFGKPPARTTTVSVVEGRTRATTTEPSGWDGQPAVVSEVETDQIRRRLAVGQKVWTADDIEVGTISDFDIGDRYFVVEKGVLARRHSLVVPVALVAEVDREEAEVTLAVAQADVDRLKREEPAGFVIELQASRGD